MLQQQGRQKVKKSECTQFRRSFDESGLASNDYDGTNEHVTFKVQKDIYNTDNKVVSDIQKIFDDLTGLYPDEEDYIQVTLFTLPRLHSK